MTGLGGSGTGDDGAGRSARTRSRDSRRRRRRRRWVGALVKGVFWLLVLAGVFVFGVGMGKELGESRTIGGEQVTIERDRGQLTYTTPTKTVVETKTVVKVKRVRVKSRRGR